MAVRRADAARNAAALVAAARELFDTAGPDIALDEVAKRAGVGNATLYRHFPTRGDLLVAAYAEEVATLCGHGADLARHPSPTDALFAWLDAFVAHVAAKRDLALAATAGPAGRRTELFDRWHASMRDTAATLADRAADALVPGITGPDLTAHAAGIALTATDPAHARRLLGHLRHGVLRPSGQLRGTRGDEGGDDGPGDKHQVRGRAGGDAAGQGVREATGERAGRQQVDGGGEPGRQ